MNNIFLTRNIRSLVFRITFWRDQKLNVSLWVSIPFLFMWQCGKFPPLFARPWGFCIDKKDVVDVLYGQEKYKFIIDHLLIRKNHSFEHNDKPYGFVSGVKRITRPRFTQVVREEKVWIGHLNRKTIGIPIKIDPALFVELTVNLQESLRLKTSSS